MFNNMKFKGLLIALFCGLFFWLAYPPLTVYKKDTQTGKVIMNAKTGEPEELKKGKLNLGLDLVGGMHLVLEVDTSNLTKDEAKDAPDRALEIIRSRIDQFGVVEPHIQKIGVNKILVQLPAVRDREKALEIVGKTAHLEFKLVNDEIDLLKMLQEKETQSGPVSEENPIKVEYKGDLYELKYYTPDRKGRDRAPIVLKDKAEMTGEYITDAKEDFNASQFNMPYVSLTLNPKGAALFAALTGSNIGKQLAIVLDGSVYSAPVIRSKIPSGQAMIEGQFTVDEARNLAIVLRAGSLPAPVKVIEERTVGPTLGKDSIEKGIKATLIGGLAVVVFMALYYLVCGLVADFALFLNIVMTLGALAYFKGTLSLPGIAGLVLTIGMSVDANVLIFERIREELKRGKSLRPALHAGFDRAFLTIFDSNLTTLIAAVLLFQFGTGPVRGFATTLSIGILTSMFTAIVVTRFLLDSITLSNPDMTGLRMMSIVKDTPKINFVGMRKIAYVLSAAVIIVGMYSFWKRGEANYSVDFTGGSIQQFRFEKPVTTDDVRAILKEIGLEKSTIQYYGNENKEIIIRSAQMDPGPVEKILKEKYPDNAFETLRFDRVGPTIGMDLRDRAIKALLIAFVCMLIYIAARFEMKFAFGGILALVHDVLVTVGILSLAGREIDTTVIAALLTIVGYSINDTIVIFDRIRENMKVMRKTSFSDIVNISLNETLSRTILTSFTVFEVLVALYFLGGPVINDFAFTLIVGCISGVYSTVFVAVPVVLDWPSKKVVVARGGQQNKK